MESITDRNRRQRLLDRFMDRGWGECSLRRPEIAALMEDGLLRFDGVRYRLLSWCVMPNHVHVLIRPIETPLGRIVGGWKGWVAHEANRILNRTGRFWQEDYWDRYIRDPDHLQRVIRYIEWNPVKARLVQGDDPRAWPWSSARRRD
jgi:REP element-mobilizing transposase RayT